MHFLSFKLCPRITIYIGVVKAFGGFETNDYFAGIHQYRKRPAMRMTMMAMAMMLHMKD
jgi:hypothetical protein